jgi:hypothetical protein
MLLEATQPITISLQQLAVPIDSRAATHNEKHSLWWGLVQKLSPFARHSRRELLNEIHQQLGLPHNWRERFLQDPILADRFLILDRSGVRQLASAGMSIGAHTLSHPILALTPDEMARQEIAESRTVLEDTLGLNVPAFAYPFGDSATVTKRDLRLAQAAGFSCAFMNIGGGFGSRIERFAMPRVHVTADMNLGEFEAHIAGFYRNLRKRLAGGDQFEVPLSA